MLANYNIDFTKLITQYLSSYKRKTVRIRWLAAITSHLNTLHTAFISHFTQQKDEMKWVGQTITLERYLQIRFGIPGLEIININLNESALIGWPCPDGKNPIGYSPVDFDSPIGYAPDAEIITKGFKIQLPASSDYNSDELRAVVNRHLIGSSEFEIIEI